MIEFKNNEVAVLPVPPEFLQSVIKIPDDRWPTATDIFNKTAEWLHKTGCLSQIPDAHIEEYAMYLSRCYECEAINAKLGLLAKHPTTGQPMASPYVQMGLSYIRQADAAWAKIYEVVKANCTNEFGKAVKPLENDRMWQVLNGNRGRD